MKEILKITLSLVVIFVVAGAILVLVYGYTGPKIAEIEKKKEQDALKEVLPEAAAIEPAGKWEPAKDKHADYYEAKDAGGNVVGYIATSYGKGYAGYIKIMVGTGSDMAVKTIKVLSHAETPGLGDEIEKAYFIDRYKGKRLDQLEVVKNPDPDRIEAISGATISSRGVTKGVRAGVEFLMEKYQGVASGK